MKDTSDRIGITEDATIVRFHTERRMFCVVGNVLHIARPGVRYAHAEWFEREGWISPDDDTAMESLVRGYVDAGGDVFFYVGHDFRVDRRAEHIFFAHLPELVRILDLRPDANVYGGKITQQQNVSWPARRAYGNIRSILARSSAADASRVER